MKKSMWICVFWMIALLAACGTEMPVTAVDVTSVPTDAIRVTDTSVTDTLTTAPCTDSAPADASMVWMEPRPMRAVRIDPATCDEHWSGALPLPWDFVQSRETVWHLCYETPAEGNSNSTHRDDPVDTIRFVLMSWNGQAHDVLRIIPDAPTPGMIVSIGLTIPNHPAGYPLFNVENGYSHDRVWAVQADEEDRVLETNGTLTARRVLNNETLLPWPLRPIVNGCLDELSPEIQSGSFLPDGETCPDEFYQCAPGRFHCDYEP